MSPPPTTHFLSGKHILLSGGGIASLSFTRALLRLWPSTLPPPKITILERDASPTASGREGYSLSLAGADATGGLVALKDLGLLDRVLEFAILGLDVGPDGGCFNVWDVDWRQVLSARLKPAEGLPTAGIRIGRRDLRKVLVEGVEGLGAQVRWGVACVGVETKEDGKVVVRVEGEGVKPGEETVECDLLVVADGAGSKVRAALRPGDKLEYAGAVQMGGIAHFPDGIPPPVDKNWGMQVSGGKGVCCFYSPVDKQGVVWALSFREEEMRPRVKDLGSVEEARPVLDEARERGAMLGPLFQTMVDATTDPTDVFSIPAKDKKAFRHDLDGGPIVFIGDSNHAISPFGGYGASLALKDGWDLAQALVSGASLRAAVQAYDDISFPRAAKVLGTSRWRIKYGHSTGIAYFLFRAFLGVGGYLLWLFGRG